MIVWYGPRKTGHGSGRKREENPQKLVVPFGEGWLRKPLLLLLAGA